MKLIIFWILFLDFFIVIYSNETINQEDVPKQTNEVVLEIYKENFEQLLKENSIMIVEFYAPWCGACKKFNPEYEKAANKLKDNVLFTKINAWNESNINLTQKYNVSGYPTVIIFQNGSWIEYTDDLNADSIVDKLKRKLRSSFKLLYSIEEFKQWNNNNDNINIIGFFHDNTSSYYNFFINIAKKYKEKYYFGIFLNNLEAEKNFEISFIPTIILLKKFDENIVYYEENKFTEQDLENFIEFHKFPLINEIGKHNYRDYIESGSFF
jgi:protein disulfide-isomerase A1